MGERSRWDEIEAVCQAALDRPPDERPAFVAAACGEDHDLRRDVDALLSHADSDAAFLESPLAAVAAHALGTDEPPLSGSRIGSLEIGRIIGRGGMGVVYLARDTRLERDVAIKVLPAVFARDPDRLARFKREALILASLNHPNIAAIYGLDDLGDRQALVLELIEGPTLDERLRARALPIEDAISVARQIADALEAAHERGIVHRDLKPANVKLRPDGIVKILDFGLATAFAPASGDGASRESNPTSDPLEPGPIFGTPTYMSPEQRAGQAADRRADIWAFGAILYEMLAGRPPFGAQAPAGDAATPEEIDWSRLHRATPDALQRLIARCLERHPRQRLRDIGEARVMLEGITPDVPAAARRARPRDARVIVAAVAAVLAATATGTAVWWVMRPPTPQRTEFPLLAANGDTAVFVDPQSNDLAISPNARTVVYKGGSSGERTRLFVRGLDRLHPVPITEPGLPKSPFFSPDGEWVGYFEPGESLALKKVAAAGGRSQVLAHLQGPSRGASWGSDGTIVVATALESAGLVRVPDTGGDPQVLTIPDAQRGERHHLWPHHLPDGRSILFTIISMNRGREEAAVAALDVASRVWRPILPGASQARYLQSGHLLYVSDQALWTVPFDVTRLQTSGPARVVVPRVLVLSTGTAEFDVARDGTLVYIADAAALSRRRMVWVNRSGHEEEITDAPPRVYAEPRLSPDGSRIAVEIGDGDRDIWVWDIARQMLTQVTTGHAIDRSPLWSADGHRIIFMRTGGSEFGALYWQAADGSGTAHRLTDSRNVRRPTSALEDGRVLYADGDDIVMLTSDSPRRVESIVSTPARELTGVVSPHEQWVAFDSIDSGGTPQIFVAPFPNADAARFSISSTGGVQPRWSRDGRELFFLAHDGMLMGVDVLPGPTWHAGIPRPVLPRNVLAGVSISLRSFDVAPDGRFLVIKGSPGATAPAPQIVVVQNWLAEINRPAQGLRGPAVSDALSTLVTATR